MNKTQHQDLVVGKLYSDLRTNRGGNATILEYVKSDVQFLYFKYHSGVRSYVENTEGYTLFPNLNQHFYPCS